LSLALPPPPPLLSNEDLARLRAARPVLWTNPKEACLTCLKKDGRTYHWYTADRTGTTCYQCDCTAQWMLHLWLLNAGIGLHYQRLTWDDIVTVDPETADKIAAYAVDAARNVSTGRNLVLWSTGAGTGKTLLLTLLCKALLAQGVEVFFSQFNEIIDLFTSSWRDKTEREQWNRRVRNVDVLAIDDLGKENKGRLDLVESMVDQVVRSRTADAAPTIITTNLTPAQIQQGYGGYVISLLSETAEFIEVTGRDFRPRQRERTLREAAENLTRPITML
jgi:DNA replication protein DnaC